MEVNHQHEILGIRFDDISIDRVKRQISGWLTGDRSHVIVTPNAEMLLQCRKDEKLRQRLNAADLAVADSVSIRYAVAALTTGQLHNRITGVDLLQDLAERCTQHNKKLILVGGARQAARDAAKKLGAKGIDPGYVDYDGENVHINESLIEKLKGADAVAVALGHGKQEAFIDVARYQLPNVRVWIGIGGALDMISGRTPRAPKYLRTVGLEWLWRLAIEPKRIPRIFRASIVFPSIVAWTTLRRADLLPATGRVLKQVYLQFKKL